MPERNLRAGILVPQIQVLSAPSANASYEQAASGPVACRAL